MANKVTKLLNEIFTEEDNMTYSLSRALWAAAFVAGVGLEIYSVLEKSNFDILAYGTGIGALLAAGGFTVTLEGNAFNKNRIKKEVETDGS